MKKNQISNRYLTAIVIMVLAISMLGNMARADEFTRVIKEKYSVDKDALLSLKNKYGDIICQNWNENAIEIKVIITVDTRDEEKAEKVFNKIDVDLSGSSSKVEGVTELSGSFNNVDFSIDYEVMMPSSISVDIVNKFGDTYLEEVNGPTEFKISYGELEATSLNHVNNNVNLKFGDGAIGYMKGGTINVSYGDIEVDGAEELEVKSSFGDAEFGKVNVLNIDSQYDEVQIAKIGTIEYVGRFADLSIDKLLGDFSFDTQYGSVEVDYITSFNEGVIYNSFGDVEIVVDEKINFTIDAEAKFGDFDFPRDWSNISHTEEGYTTDIYKGYVGEREGAGSLKVRVKNGAVSIN